MHDWVPNFLKSLAEHGIVRTAANLAAVDRTTVYRRKESDEEFAKAFDDAMETAIDTLEQEARRRALHGVEEPVIYQGQPTPLFERDAAGNVVMDDGGRPKLRMNPDGTVALLTIRKPSDAMMALMLKGRRKRVFADRTEITGADGGPVKHADESSRAARAAQLLAVAQARKDANDLVGDEPPAWADLV